MKTLRSMRALTLSFVMSSLAASPAIAAPPPPDQVRAEMAKMFGFVPGAFAGMPAYAWEQMKSLQLNPGTALSGKVKELVGLAVSSQIPCTYCIYAHTKFAALNGATQSEIDEAVATGAATRFWSTWLNGSPPDEAKFRAEVARLVDVAKKGPPATPPRDIALTDARAAREDITQHVGFVPSFLEALPDSQLPAMWGAMRATDFTPGALDMKVKSLISLAVASQIPCRYCVIADGEFARLSGASELELKEAVLMSALTRELSTMLNGTQVDLAQFKRDVDKLLVSVKKMARANAH